MHKSRGAGRQRERVMDGAEDDRDIFVTEASKVEMETETRQGHFFPHPLTLLQYVLNQMSCDE